MNFKKTVPQWNAVGTEPPDSLKNSGFVSGYKPPAPYFNWFWHSVSQCLQELYGMTPDDIAAMPLIDARSADYDMDEILVSGMHHGAYRTNSATLGTPFKHGVLEFSAGLIISYANSATFAVQLALVSGAEHLYMRSVYNGTVTDWIEIASAADLAKATTSLKSHADRTDYPHKVNAVQAGAHALSERGTLIPASSNLNDYTTAGDYFVSGATDAQTIANSPMTGSGYRLIVEVGYVPSYIRQYAIGVGGNIQTRYYQTSWSEWMKLLTDKDMEGSIYYHSSQQLTKEDLDTVTKSGFYYAAGSNSCLNTPIGDGSAFGLEVVKSASAYYTQIVYVADAVFTRYYNGSTWQDWARVYTTKYKPTPADIKALPTAGGAMTGTLTTKGVVLTEGIDYGTELPSDAPKGKLFFLKV